MPLNKLHVAIIMDGNRRWAKSHQTSVKNGHYQGMMNIFNLSEQIIDYKFSISDLSLFCFSTENIDRSSSEINDLLNNLFEIINETNFSTFWKKGIFFNIISLPNTFLNKIQINRIKKIELLQLIFGKNKQFNLKTKLKDLQKKQLEYFKEQRIFKQLVVNLLFNYSGKADLLYAISQLTSVKNVNEKVLHQHLISRDLSDVNLMIRTSGEQRISNFLLWQIAYSELIFVDNLWPDFTRRELKFCIDTYLKRNRRFGK